MMVEKSPVIHLGAPSDEEDMMILAKKAWLENGINDIDDERMRGMIKPALFLWDGCVGLIRGNDNRIEGAALLRITTPWYSRSKILEEKAIFVDPEFRKANRARQQISHANALCAFSKKVATDLGLPLLIGVLSNKRTEAKVKFYERQFGPMSGAFFLWNGHTGHDERLTEH